VAPRILLLDGVPFSRSRPRVLGEGVACVLPDSVLRGVAAGVPRGVTVADAPREAVAAGEAVPAGVALAPALCDEPVAVVALVDVVAPVVVLEPVVVLPETPTPTAAPPLTP
jgi:hypothetical protein